MSTAIARPKPGEDGFLGIGDDRVPSRHPSWGKEKAGHRPQAMAPSTEYPRAQFTWKDRMLPSEPPPKHPLPFPFNPITTTEASTKTLPVMLAKKQATPYPPPRGRKPEAGMGTGSQCWVLAGALTALLSAQLAVESANEPFPRAIIIPPNSVSPSVSSLHPAHNGQVCSTWGDFHFKTFDGYIFRFPGLCNYILASHCQAPYEDFNIQLRRRLTGDRPIISHIVLKVEGLVLELANSSVFVDGQRVQLPYSRAGLLVERSNGYFKISIRMVLTFFWNADDSALLELDTKYANKTCGLCGDFNGLPVFNELYAHNVRLTEIQFGNLQKLDGPMELCQDPLPTLANNCTSAQDICYHVLLGAAFAQCNTLVDPEPYVTSCAQDLCLCPNCPCATFTEYSRQCAHAGGQPQNWRSPSLCPQTCPEGMRHEECSSPCVDTCSNPDRAQLCEDHCEDGCFCPPGTVLDDITHTGCVSLKQCPCTYQGRTYSPGATFTTSCSSCTCSGGRWQCEDLPCPGTCFVQGGAHISTYDEKLYDLHGDCSYVLSKRCTDNTFSVLAELRRCGLTETESCLKSVTLSLHSGDTTIRIQASGAVFMNSIYTQLPVSAANITVFRPSSFFVLVQTGLGLQLQVQLVPVMQVYIRLTPTHHGQMCGLCGNFNQNQADDFTALSGVVEGTGAAFANTWKTQTSCPNAKNSFEDPCSLSVENENYARHWCALLTDPAGAFATCHSVVNPTPFHSNCMFDTCNCEKSEDCLCAVLSAYVHACASKGVLLRGWRDRVCAKYANNCPKSQSYAYVLDTCQPTCRGLSEADVTCRVSFVPVDGCTCPLGSYLDESGNCVPKAQCPCYLHGTVVAPGEVVHDNGAVCSCSGGKLSCLGVLVRNNTGCTPPMVYMDCSNALAGTPGAECSRSCHTLDVDCFSTHCVSGCVCPSGLVSDDNGGCIAQEDCPCVHNEATYQPGDTIRVDCNTCTCKNRKWECSSQPCLGTCVAYGDGHFITFDGDRYNFEGNCEYMLAQDYCGGNVATNGTFRIVTENIPCGTTGVTCSKAIKVFLERHELILTEGHLKVVERGPGQDLPYRMRYMGVYLIIETHSGLVLSWDRKTSIFIRLHPSYKGKVCGLCGNFDGNAINDFTTRSHSVVSDVLEFGNSWKFSPSCPDALAPRDPCTANPYRKSWAQKQCSILHSATFATCQSQVDSTKYYEACVSDACACDSGGDCECFCTAVAAYAQACQDAGVCVSWRSPEVCPLFCDYYNPHGECEWHYQPCGAPCMRTCRNPSGHCLLDLPGLEGCYPRCPPSKPFFSEDQMKCVAQCGCYDEDGNYYEVNEKVTTTENCKNCTCTTSGIRCQYSLDACTCIYEGKTYGYKEVIYNTTDGLGACLVAICGNNGTIQRNTVECPGTLTTSPPFTFTTTMAPQSTTGSALTSSSAPTVCVQEVCTWSKWYDASHPEPGLGGGEFETLANLRKRGYQVCTEPADIQCRAQALPHIRLEELGQKVKCDRFQGLISETMTKTQPFSSSVTLVTKVCQPRCQWTEWFDVDHPTSGIPGGDMETFENIRAAGGKLCLEPEKIECRAENYPEVSLDQIGQVVTCSLEEGLICKNEDQQGHFNLCFNYNMRVLCCDYRHCRSTVGPTATSMSTRTEGLTSSSASSALSSPGLSSQVPTTETTLSVTSVSVTPHFTSQVPTPASTARTSPSVFPTIKTSPVTSAPITTATTSKRTTACRPRCEWTEWFDVDHPTSGIPGGDLETFENIRAAGGKLCLEPEKIECRAENYPEVSLDQIGQVVTCSLQEGLICKNEDQQGRFNLCFNYNVRVLCCDYQHCRSTVGPTPTSRATSTITGLSSASVSTSSMHIPSTSPHSSTLTSTAPFGTTISPSPETPLLFSTTLATSPTVCEPICTWTDWMDESYPIPGAAGGDFETYDNLRVSGQAFCDLPVDIQCRSELQPDTPLLALDQVVHCNVTFGLICRNQEQRGTPKYCHNYHVRVLCCVYRGNCPSTPASTITPTPYPGVSSTPVITTLTHSTHLVTSSSSTQTTTSIPQGGSTSCQPNCTWTDWMDESFPLPGASGGDFETYKNLRAAGLEFCDHPVDIHCRSERQPDTPLAGLDQVVQCSVNFGLICRNRQQRRAPKYCHNYHIRVLCCDYSKCLRTFSTSTMSPPGVSPSSASTLTAIPWKRHTASASTTVPPSPALSPLSPYTSPTTCQPACYWTDWLDSDQPKPGPFEGDIEIYYNILNAGHRLCQQPTAIQCEAVKFPGVALGALSQRVLCSVQFGLICRNKMQKNGQICLNYHVRVQCCDDISHCRTTTGPTSAHASTATSGHPTSTTGVPTTELLVPTPWTGLPGPSSLPTTTQFMSTRETTLQSTSSSTSTAAQSLQTHSPTATRTTTQPVTSSESQGTTSCQPRCQWTDWFDEDYPKSEKLGGDIETYDKIRRAGWDICDQPQDIECQAVTFPNTTLTQLGQKVHCNVSFGFICRNLEQEGTFKMCYNYRIRVLCCSKSHCASTMPPTWTPSASTSKVLFPSTGLTIPISSTHPLLTSTLMSPNTEVPRSSPASSATTSSRGSTSVPETHTTWRATTVSVSPQATTQGSTTPSTTRSPSVFPTQKTSPETPAPITTTMTAQGTTACRPRCQWTEWFDVDHPTSGIPGGDMETFENIRAASGKLCLEPQKVECRAENYPEVSLDQIGQVVTCSLQEGLICKNEDQQGSFNLCFNYNVRVLCCDDYRHCRATVGPTATTGSTRTEGLTSPPKPFLLTTLGPSSRVPETHTTLNVTTVSVSPPSRSLVTMPTSQASTSPSVFPTRKTSPESPALITTPTTAQGSTACRPRCEWTKWYDVDHPTSGIPGGDMETFENIRAAGGKLCLEPQKIECRAETYPEVSLDKIGQVVTCRLQEGLICKNEDQKGRFKMCFNYNVRVLCCDDYEHCRSTVGPTAATTSKLTEGLTSPSASSAKTSPGHSSQVPKTEMTLSVTTGSVSPHVTSQVPTPTSTPSTTSVLPITETSPWSPALLTTATTAQETTACRPRCEWTEWFDVDHPTSGIPGGDMETLENIRGAGGRLCLEPEKIECRAENYPEVSLDQIGQVVTCSLQEGLICKNEDQQGHFNLCFNYNVRVLCCDYRHCRTTVRPTATTRSTRTVGLTSSPVPFVLTTPRPSSRVPETHTTLSVTTVSVSPHLTSQVPTPASTAGTSPSVFPTIETSPVTSAPITTATTSKATTACRPRCEWTEWFDVDHPTSGIPGGDMETFENIRTAGGRLCLEPEKIECRAENYPEVSLDQIGQVVTCSLEEGLICKNEDQQGSFNLCFNYNVRVLCCDYRHCRTTVRPTATTRSTRTEGIISLSASSALTSQRLSSQVPTTETTVSVNTVSVSPQSTTLMHMSTSSESISPSVFPTRKTSRETLAPVTTATTAQGTTACWPKCQWTEWFDVDHPTSGIPGGDMETFENIRTAGGRLCLGPEKIECRAENYPEVSLDQIGQVVTCSLQEGLICKNEDQQGEFNMCFNYNVRVLCCDYRHCRTTVGPTATTRSTRTEGITTPSPSSALTSPRPSSQVPTTETTQTVITVSVSPHFTSQVPTPASTARTSPSVFPTSETSPVTSAPITTATTSKGTTACQPRCQWTEWFDVDHPTSGIPGGDMETFENIRTAGGRLCLEPEKIECRAENYPEVSLDQIGQVVTCSLEEGLICKNEDQQGRFNSCFNYNVRVLCCDYRHCRSTGPRNSHHLECDHTTTSKGTTACQPRCQWTEWFDVDHPTSGSPRGDMETFENIRAAGGRLCLEPEKIECRAENYPEVSLDQIGQVVTCSLEEGLICKNEDQQGRFNSCFNYNVRVLCCDYRHCRTTGPRNSHHLECDHSECQTSLDISATTSKATSACRPRCEWTEWFDVDHPTSGSPGGDMETFENIRAAGGRLCLEPEKIECRAENYPEVSLDQIGQVVTCSLEDGLICKNEDQQGRFNLCFNYNVRVLCCDYRHCRSTGPRKSHHLECDHTTTSKGTTACQPRCQWTEWFDVDHPTSGIPGGDMETFENIRTAGGRLCLEPEKIECRAENYPEVSLDQIGQVVTCSLQEGLICKNEDQQGRFNLCFNYNVRVLCCDYRHCRSTVGPTATTRSTHTEGIISPSASSALTSQRLSSQVPTTETTVSMTTVSVSPQSTSPMHVSTSSESISPSVFPTRKTSRETLAPVTTATTAQGTTACRPRCQWTEWFDVDHPSSDLSGGDMETFENIRAAGGKLCLEPEKIECRAENYTDLSLDQIGQVVTCSLQEGLICKNEDQQGDFNMCFNYNVRVLCCDYRHCRTTVGTTATSRSIRTEGIISPPSSMVPITPGPYSELPQSESTVSVTTVSVSPQKTSLVSTSPSISSKIPSVFPTRETSPETPAPVTTATTAQGTTACRPRCQWTEWFDVDHPTSGIPGGDVETFENIRAAGGKLCLKPEKIECRAENYPEVSLDQIGQVVTCSLEEGLICKNEDQQGRFNLCFNYNVRVLCCDYRHCRTTVRPTATTRSTRTEGITTPSASSALTSPQLSSQVPTTETTQIVTTMSVSPHMTSEVPTPASTARTSPSVFPTSETSPMTSAPISTATTSKATTFCKPRCQWTEWFDVDHPTSGIPGGDMETFENIRTAGGRLCLEPEKIECRAENYPEVSLDQIGQVVTCSLQEGLICKNEDQQGRFNLCFNYNVRVLCCDYRHCRTTVRPTTTTRSTRTEGIITPSASSALTSPWLSSQVPTTETTQIVTTVSVSPHLTSQVPTPASTARTSPSVFPTSETSPMTSAPITTATTSKGTTACQPRCQWTEWFDVDHPTSGIPGGDLETFENILTAGGRLCLEPEKIECRAENYPEVSLDQIGQVVTCSLEEGLICKNEDQQGRFNSCFNYNVRVLCCDYRHCRSTVGPTATTRSTRTEGITTPSASSALTSPQLSSQVPTTETTQIVTTVSVSPHMTSEVPTPASTARTSPSVFPTSETSPMTSAPITTATTSKGTTACKPRCQWTEWFDVDHPTSGIPGGDMETFENIRTAGGRLCLGPEKIECRAENYPEVSLDQIGQVVTCSLEEGLICKNEDQQGRFNLCFNYNVRVLCCDYRHCRTTVRPTATTRSTRTEGITTPSPSSALTSPRLSSQVPTTETTQIVTTVSVSPHLTSQVPTPASIARTSPSVFPTSETSPMTSAPITTATTSKGTTACKPRCQWTEWFDVDHPTSGIPGGDMETFENIRTAGGRLCLGPEKIECRAENYPEVSLDQIGQVVTCSLEEGLICKNEDQQGRFNLCFNYNVRVLCCDYRHCRTTVRPTATTRSTRTEGITTPSPSSALTSPRLSSQVPTTETTQIVTTVSVSPHLTSQVPTPASTARTSPSVFPTSETSPMTSAPITTATTSKGTTACQPRCQWTEWFDVDHPTSGIPGGDMETFENIRTAGGRLCLEPEKIECRAENYPEVSLDQIGQVVTCSLEEGLICKNEDQQGRFNSCFNYNVRVLCCDYRHCRSTVGPTATSMITRTKGPTSPPRPFVLTTPGPSSRLPESHTTLSVTAVTVTPQSTTPMPTSTSRASISPSVFPTRKTSRETLAPVTTAITAQGSTTCRPKCQWTEWFDVDLPTSGIPGGDMETFENIRASGGKLCLEPDKIECRAENYTDLSLDQIGQVVTCSLQEGLICKNEDQQGDFHMCFNYNVRVLCCDYQHCRSTVGPTATSRATSTITGLSSASVSTSSMPIPSTSPHSSTLTSTAPFGTTISPSPETPLLFSTTLATSPTICEPICTWTDWMDESYPIPGAAGGDFETYDNLRVSGQAFCDLPVDIQCRSELQPDTPLLALDQVVHCNVTFGLICRNQEQRGTPKYCHNYHVYNLLINPNSSDKWNFHLPVIRSTPDHPTVTPPTPGGGSTTCEPICTWTDWMDESYPIPGASGGDFETYDNLRVSGQAFCDHPVDIQCRPTSSSSRTSITRCYCQAFGKLFSPGDIIYNKTDMAGCHFYAVCNQQCEIDRFQGACTTTLPPASSVVPSSVPVTVLSPSPAPGCDHTVPPRKVNETWTLPDCTVARCEGDNHIVLLKPKPVANITCVNEHQPIKVQNQSDPCDYHYECECICTGWGNSHYSTFDGTSYSFLDNCTYVLLREIHPRLGNLSVLIDNYYCPADPAEATHCSRALLIYYLSTEVVLTVIKSGGTMQSLILFNGTHVSQGFSKNGINISETTGGTMGVDIPAIGAHITFDGNVFQIQLSYNQFNHNTEGQCGTCTNSRVDDCRRPDGTIAPTCEDMAPFWLVPGRSKEGCMAPTSPPPSTSPQLKVSTPPTTSISSAVPTSSIVPTSTTCPPNPLCVVILSPVFADCHKLVPPGQFFNACVSDSCQGGHAWVPCESLEAYAKLCRAWGVCSDWRNATGGLCGFSCPPPQVYKPCGPMQPETCDSRSQNLVTSGLAEGCFCPDGEILFNKYSKICVPECPCVGPDGNPKFPGSKWISNCQACECRENPVAVHCQPVQCEPPTKLPLACEEPGFVKVTQPQVDNPCCPETFCVCNTTTCPEDPPRCGPGMELVRTDKADSCCPTFSCRPLFCFFNETFYGVGATIPGIKPCHTCTCSLTGNQTVTVQCKENVCNTTACSQGFEPRKLAGQCCEECVQTACLTPEGQPVKLNDTWVNKDVDNCTESRCVTVNGHFVFVQQPVLCPKELACLGVIRKNGCCYTCEEVDKCQVRVNKTVLRRGDCKTQGAVSLTFCEGFCPGMSVFPADGGAVQHQCTCCKETKKHEELVTLHCPDGTQIRQTYTHVDECSCNPWCWDEPPTRNSPVV
ncbi:mucin-5B [Rhynchocyon petersi]